MTTPRVPMTQAMRLLTSSEHNSWYTPSRYIEMAREVLGGIDLDPASHSVPQQWIKAKKYYTKEDDGLAQIWAGQIFLNCPFGKTKGKSNQDIWAKKLISEYEAGRVSAAILLTKTVPGYVWWDDLFTGGWPGPCCITYGRIAFINGEDPAQSGRAKAASTFWYAGSQPGEFRRVFSQVGRVLPQGQRRPQ